MMRTVAVPVASSWLASLPGGTGFDPDRLRALGWPGEIFPIGGGVFNGGAWLRTQAAGN